MNTINVIVTEAQFDAAKAEVIACNRLYTARLDTDDYSDCGALDARHDAAQAVIAAFWAQAPGGFLARELGQVADI